MEDQSPQSRADKWRDKVSQLRAKSSPGGDDPAHKRSGQSSTFRRSRNSPAHRRSGASRSDGGEGESEEAASESSGSVRKQSTVDRWKEKIAARRAARTAQSSEEGTSNPSGAERPEQAESQTKRPETVAGEERAESKGEDSGTSKGESAEVSSWLEALKQKKRIRGQRTEPAAASGGESSSSAAPAQTTSETASEVNNESTPSKGRWKDRISQIKKQAGRGSFYSSGEGTKVQVKPPAATASVTEVETPAPPVELVESSDGTETESETKSEDARVPTDQPSSRERKPVVDDTRVKAAEAALEEREAECKQLKVQLRKNVESLLDSERIIGDMRKKLEDGEKRMQQKAKYIERMEDDFEKMKAEYEGAGSSAEVLRKELSAAQEKLRSQEASSDEALSKARKDLDTAESERVHLVNVIKEQRVTWESENSTLRSERDRLQADLDSLTSEHDTTVARQRSTESELLLLKAQSTQLKQKLESELEDAKEKLQQSSKQREAAVEQAGLEWREKVASQASRISELEELTAQLESRVREAEDGQTALQLRNQELSDVNERLETQKKSELDKHHDKQKSLQQEISKLKSGQSRELSLSSLAKERDELRISLLDAEAHSVKLSDTIRNMEGNLSTMEELKAELKSLQSTKKAFEEQEKRVHSLEARNTEFTTKIAELQKQHQDLRNENQKLRTVKSDLDQARDECDRVSEKNGRLQSELRASREQYEEEHQRLEALSAQKQEIEDELDSVKRELISLGATGSESDSTIEVSLNALKAEMVKARGRARDLARDLKDKSKELEGLKGELDKISKENHDLRDKVSKMETSKTEALDTSTELEGRVEALSSDVLSLQEKNTSLEEQLSTAQGTIAELEGLYKASQQRESDLLFQVDELTVQAEELKAAVANQESVESTSQAIADREEPPADIDDRSAQPSVANPEGEAGEEVEESSFVLSGDDSVTGSSDAGNEKDQPPHNPYPSVSPTRIRKILSMHTEDVASVASSSSFVTAAAYDQKEGELVALQQQLAASRDELASTQQQLLSSQATTAELKDNIDLLNVTLSSLEGELAANKEALHATTEQLREETLRGVGVYNERCELMAKLEQSQGSWESERLAKDAEVNALNDKILVLESEALKKDAALESHQHELAKTASALETANVDLKGLMEKLHVYEDLQSSEELIRRLDTMSDRLVAVEGEKSHLRSCLLEAGNMVGDLLTNFSFSGRTALPDLQWPSFEFALGDTIDSDCNDVDLQQEISNRIGNLTDMFNSLVSRSIMLEQQLQYFNVLTSDTAISKELVDRLRKSVASRVPTGIVTRSSGRSLTTAWERQLAETKFGDSFPFKDVMHLVFPSDEMESVYDKTTLPDTAGLRAASILVEHVLDVTNIEEQSHEWLLQVISHVYDSRTKLLVANNADHSPKCSDFVYRYHANTYGNQNMVLVYNACFRLLKTVAKYRENDVNVQLFERVLCDKYDISDFAVLCRLRHYYCQSIGTTRNQWDLDGLQAATTTWGKAVMFAIPECTDVLYNAIMNRLKKLLRVQRRHSFGTASAHSRSSLPAQHLSFSGYSGKQSVIASEPPSQLSVLVFIVAVLAEVHKHNAKMYKIGNDASSIEPVVLSDPAVYQKTPVKTPAAGAHTTPSAVTLEQLASADGQSDSPSSGYEPASAALSNLTMSGLQRLVFSLSQWVHLLCSYVETQDTSFLSETEKVRQAEKRISALSNQLAELQSSKENMERLSMRFGAFLKQVLSLQGMSVQSKQIRLHKIDVHKEGTEERVLNVLEGEWKKQLGRLGDLIKSMTTLQQKNSEIQRRMESYRNSVSDRERQYALLRKKYDEQKLELQQVDVRSAHSKEMKTFETIEASTMTLTKKTSHSSTSISPRRFYNEIVSILGPSKNDGESQTLLVQHNRFTQSDASKSCVQEPPVERVDSAALAGFTLSDAIVTGDAGVKSSDVAVTERVGVKSSDAIVSEHVGTKLPGAVSGKEELESTVGPAVTETAAITVVDHHDRSDPPLARVDAHADVLFPDDDNINSGAVPYIVRAEQIETLQPSASIPGGSEQVEAPTKAVPVASSQHTVPVAEDRAITSSTDVSAPKLESQDSSSRLRRSLNVPSIDVAFKDEDQPDAAGKGKATEHPTKSQAPGGEGGLTASVVAQVTGGDAPSKASEETESADKDLALPEIASRRFIHVQSLRFIRLNKPAEGHRMIFVHLRLAIPARSEIYVDSDSIHSDADDFAFDAKLWLRDMPPALRSRQDIVVQVYGSRKYEQGSKDEQKIKKKFLKDLLALRGVASGDGKRSSIVSKIRKTQEKREGVPMMRVTLDMKDLRELRNPRDQFSELRKWTDLAMVVKFAGDSREYICSWRA